MPAYHPCDSRPVSHPSFPDIRGYAADQGWPLGQRRSWQPALSLVIQIGRNIHTVGNVTMNPADTPCCTPIPACRAGIMVADTVVAPAVGAASDPESATGRSRLGFDAGLCCQLGDRGVIETMCNAVKHCHGCGCFQHPRLLGTAHIDVSGWGRPWLIRVDSAPPEVCRPAAASVSLEKRIGIMMIVQRVSRNGTHLPPAPFPATCQYPFHRADRAECQHSGKQGRRHSVSRAIGIHHLDCGRHGCGQLVACCQCRKSPPSRPAHGPHVVSSQRG